MAGASSNTQRVTHVNANWTAAADRGPAGFELLVVTEDEQRHTATVPAADVPGLVAIVQASPVLLWDPDGQTLIAANLHGQWISPTWSAGQPRLG